MEHDNNNTATRILLVEDDKAVAKAMQVRLEHEGYAVFVAQDAISALAVARESQPEVALLDINIPGGSGFDVARRLENTTANVAKIFITASRAPGLREQAIEVGARAFMEKPFTAAELKQAISEALGTRPHNIPSSVNL